jgi:hypothetical protein
MYLATPKSEDEYVSVKTVGESKYLLTYSLSCFSFPRAILRAVAAICSGSCPISTNRATIFDSFSQRAALQTDRHLFQ